MPHHPWHFHTSVTSQPPLVLRYINRMKKREIIGGLCWDGTSKSKAQQRLFSQLASMQKQIVCDHIIIISVSLYH